jgi:RNA polymerase sigma-70 factor (ECF subfamily)
MRGTQSQSVNSDAQQGRYADFKEADLIKVVKDEPDAFGELYRRNVDRIYTYIYYRTGNPPDAEDLTARTFHQALSHLPRYSDQGLPFIAWLYRIAHNLVANHHRSQSRWKMASLEDSDAAGRPAEGPERVAELNERKAALWAAIRRQPEERQQLLILKYAERLSNEEIGEAMGRTESAIKSLYFRTLKALKVDLESRGW